MRRNEGHLPRRWRGGSELSPWRSEWESWPFGGTAFQASPWQMMRRMQEDMDAFFNQMFGGGIQQGSTTAMQTWSPNVDVSQTDKEWCIEAELPGVERDNIQVEVNDHLLTIRAEMRQESQTGGPEDKQRDYFHRERRYGFFERTLPLPENADEANIRCEFRNGVLRIDIPKTAQSQQQPRRIPISTDGASPQGTQRLDRPQNLAASAGRNETSMELEEEAHEEPAMAGAKGGETSSTDLNVGNKASRKK